MKWTIHSYSTEALGLQKGGEREDISLHNEDEEDVITNRLLLLVIFTSNLM
jgi:hypothetical protein